MVTANDKIREKLALTDCTFFKSGQCKFGSICVYRHCQEAIQQSKECPNWPSSCTNKNCMYRHTIQMDITTQNLIKRKDFISFFWDIENVPIPKGQKPFDIVQRIRNKFVVERGLQEAEFSCICNVNRISKDSQGSLHHAAVRMIHVPDLKTGSADRQIMLELDRFERIHHPPTTLVLISGDIDFVGKLNHLRHQAGFHVIVIHNQLAKKELQTTANEHYTWAVFTDPVQQTNVTTGNHMDRSRSQQDHWNLFSNNVSNQNARRDQDEASVDKWNRSRSKSSYRYYNGDNSHQNNAYRENFSNMHTGASSAHRNSRRMDSSRSRESQADNYPSQAPMLYFSSDTPSLLPTSKSSHQTRSRQSASTSGSNLCNRKPILALSVGPSSTIEDDHIKPRAALLSSPQSSDQSPMTHSSNQHQEEKKPISSCTAYENGFVDSEDLNQHKIAKQHDNSKNTSSQNNLQSNQNTNDDFSMPQLLNGFGNKLNLWTNSKSPTNNREPHLHPSTTGRDLNNNED